MPSPVSSNRYSPLGEADELRIEMSDLPLMQQAAASNWKDSAREPESIAFSASSPSLVRLETKPPPRRGMTWPLFTAKKPVNVRVKLHEEWLKTRAAVEPELRERHSLVEVSDCTCTRSFSTGLTSV